MLKIKKFYIRVAIHLEFKHGWTFYDGNYIHVSKKKKRKRLNSKDKFEDSYHWNCTLFIKFSRGMTRIPTNEYLWSKPLYPILAKFHKEWLEFQKYVYEYLLRDQIPTFNLHWTDSQNFYSNFFFLQNFKRNKL